MCCASRLPGFSAMRNGVGWTLGIGRIGSVVGRPQSVAVCSPLGRDNLHSFLCGATPALIAAAATTVIDAKRLLGCQVPEAAPGRQKA